MVDDRPTRSAALSVSRGRFLAAHADFDGALVEAAPRIAIAIEAWIRWVDLLAVQVACRGGVVGDRPGDAAVEPPPQARHARVPGAGRVVVRSVQSVFVPARRHPEWLVGVAG